MVNSDPACEAGPGRLSSAFAHTRATGVQQPRLAVGCELEKRVVCLHCVACQQGSRLVRGVYSQGEILLRYSCVLQDKGV